MVLGLDSMKLAAFPVSEIALDSDHWRGNRRLYLRLGPVSQERPMGSVDLLMRYFHGLLRSYQECFHSIQHVPDIEDPSGLSAIFRLVDYLWGIFLTYIGLLSMS